MAGDSKTEKATPKKRRDERKKGHVFLSQDAVAVATLFGSICMLKAVFVHSVAAIQGLFYTCFDYAGQAPAARALSFLSQVRSLSVTVFLETAGPLLLVTVAVAIAATFAQTRMMVSGELLKPQLNRISPLQGFKKLFSLRSVVEAAKGILKITVLLYLIYTCVRKIVDVAANYLYMDLGEGCAHLFDSIFHMMLSVGLAFLVLAAFDFLYQWWEYERQLKMSKQEVKEEYKQMEGDPQVKGKIKEVQRKMSQARMMRQVPGADVVVRNPSHYAVALRYKPGQDQAPFVLAKGQDALALRIVRVAEEHGVAVIENVPLARALYAQAELSREIPPELYGAVAEVLVYLYKLDSGQSGEEKRF